jgi:DNA-binding beta-propeller fold protein YncE
MRSTQSIVALIALLEPGAVFALAPACYATQTSLTPATWHAPARAAQAAPTSGLTLLREIPLPGPANRFDYQSFDPVTRRIYMNHMNAGRTVVFDTDSNRVLTEIGDLPRATGVWAVPSHHQVYVSAAGAHEVAIIDDRTLKVTSRVGDIRFPDGIAYAPETDKVFVSDESGAADVVIDAATGAKRSTIALGGEAGNTHYDSVSHCILVAVQTKNQMVAIDPVTEKIVERYDLAGSAHPHGFTLDEEARLLFMTSEGNATLQVIDLRTMKVLAQHKTGDGPDVLAWDPAWRRLYVASEGGVLSAFWLDGTTLKPVGEVRAPHAHTVSVDPRTHRVYVPLENIDGKPLLRIYEPATAGANARPQSSVLWNFDNMPADKEPTGFTLARTGSGRVGRWAVRAVADAPSAPNVLAQEDSDRTDYRFPVAVEDGSTYGDVRVSVRCKAVAGRVDRACGIVWRYQDENNYYLTRANALENNVCWYYVQNGRRIEVKRVNVPVASDVWHSLRADMRGDHVEVYFNDKKLIDVHDSRFTAPGKIGVWTKADSRTLFDNLTATPLTP